MLSLLNSINPFASAPVKKRKQTGGRKKKTTKPQKGGSSMKLTKTNLKKVKDMPKTKARKAIKEMLGLMSKQQLKKLQKKVSSKKQTGGTKGDKDVMTMLTDIVKEKGVSKIIVDIKKEIEKTEAYDKILGKKKYVPKPNLLKYIDPINDKRFYEDKLYFIPWIIKHYDENYNEKKMIELLKKIRKDINETSMGDFKVDYIDGVLKLDSLRLDNRNYHDLVYYQNFSDDYQSAYDATIGPEDEIGDINLFYYTNELDDKKEIADYFRKKYPSLKDVEDNKVATLLFFKDTSKSDSRKTEKDIVKDGILKVEGEGFTIMGVMNLGEDDEDQNGGGKKKTTKKQKGGYSMKLKKANLNKRR